MLKPPDSLPNSLWEAIGYTIVVVASLLVTRMAAKTPPKPAALDSSEESNDKDAVIKEFLEEKILQLRDEMNSRIDSLEEELTIHREYIAVLSSIEGFTDPPFPSLARFRQERQQRNQSS